MRDIDNEGQHTFIVVLAAGTSSRLGRPKQLLKWQGETLIGRMVGEANQVARGSTLVVTGAYRQEVVQAIAGCRFTEIFNPDFSRGIGTSIKAAVACCMSLSLSVTKDRLDFRGLSILFVGCDQLFVDSRVLNQLVETFYIGYPSNDVVVCDYGPDLGLPVIINPRLWEDLGLLGDDEGAKKIWNTPKVTRQTISCPQALWDIDTQEDCVRFGIG